MCRPGRNTVLIAQNTWVHYRQDLVKALQADDRLAVTLIHDPRGPIATSADAIQPMASPIIESELVAPLSRLGPVLWQPGLVRAMRSGRFDAVILQGDPFNLANWVVLFQGAYGRRRTPVLLWTHGWSRADPPLRRMVKRQFFGLGSRVLVYSRRAVSIGISEGHAPERLVFIGNSLPAPSEAVYEAAPSHPHQCGPGPIRIVTVVRLTVDRELDELLEAMELLQSRDLGVRLDLAGGGEDRGRLESLAQSAGLDVTFHGPVYDASTLASLYAGADLTVVPGRAGLAVAQALHHGVPVIAHNDFAAQMPEASAIGEGITGEFYPRHDPAALAAQIEKVASGRRAGKYTAEECRQAAHDNFSTELHASRIVEAVLDAVERPGRPRLLRATL